MPSLTEVMEKYKGQCKMLFAVTCHECGNSSFSFAPYMRAAIAEFLDMGWWIDHETWYCQPCHFKNLVHQILSTKD